ncbi:MAG: hypothetical protein ACI8V7_000360, partial [Candidatus Paceibacteria bacterium]
MKSLEEFNFDNKKYISSKKTGEILGYTSDYIAKLCREGKLDGRKKGRGWFVSEESVQNFNKVVSHDKEILKTKLAKDLTKEYVVNRKKRGEKVSFESLLKKVGKTADKVLKRGVYETAKVSKKLIIAIPFLISSILLLGATLAFANSDASKMFTENFSNSENVNSGSPFLSAPDVFQKAKPLVVKSASAFEKTFAKASGKMVASVGVENSKNSNIFVNEEIVKETRSRSHIKFDNFDEERFLKTGKIISMGSEIFLPVISRTLDIAELVFDRESGASTNVKVTTVTIGEDKNVEVTQSTSGTFDDGISRTEVHSMDGQISIVGNEAGDFNQANVAARFNVFSKNTAYGFYCSVISKFGRECGDGDQNGEETNIVFVKKEENFNTDKVVNEESKYVTTTNTYPTYTTEGLTKEELEVRLDLFASGLDLGGDTIINNKTTKIINNYDNQLNAIFDSMEKISGNVVNNITSLDGLTLVDATTGTFNYLTVTATSTFAGDVNFEAGITLNDMWGTAGQVLTSQGTSTDPVWTDTSITIGNDVFSGTSGSILFVDSTGSLAQDNSNFYYGETNGYLGFGTSSPDVRLHIGSSTPSSISSSDYYNSAFISGDLEVDGTLHTNGITFSGAANMVASFDGSGNLVATSSPNVSIITATSTTATSTLPNLTVTSFNLGGDFINDITGTGLNVLGGALVVDDSVFFSLSDWYGTTTDALAEGSNNYYWTQTRFDSALAATSSVASISTLVNLSITESQISDLDHYGILDFASNLAGTTTDALSEGSANLYFTEERVDDRTSTLIQNGTGISWSYDDGAGTLTPTISLSSFTTDALTEGSSNLYWTNTRFDNRLSATTTLPSLTT